MTIEQLNALIDANDVDKTINVLDTHCLVKGIADSIKQYLPDSHDVRDPFKRMDKMITDSDGRPESPIKVNRLSLPMQKNIVMIATAFMGVPTMDCVTSSDIEKLMLELLEKTEEDNKLEYDFRQVIKHTKSERQCAELWYAQEVEKDYYEGYATDASFRLRMKILAPSLGDCLYPVYDNYGDMIAFGRKYEIIGYDGTGKEEKIIHFDLYTKDRFYFIKKIATGWVENNEKPTIDPETGKSMGLKNPFGKIPVIYYSQPYTEWHDVQPLIDRLEAKISNHADTNDYYDSPIVFAEGEIEGFADKSESGKLLKGRNGAKVSYLTWDSAPESMKMEIENLITFIGQFSHTPNVSMDNLKGLGDFTGVALQMLFLDAHLKAQDSEEIFGKGVQRRINYLKTVYSVLDPKLKVALKLKIKPKFKYFLPENIDEQVSILAKAVSAKLLSNESAIKLNPLVQDPENEAKLIGEEKQANADFEKENAPKPVFNAA